ncbi:DUF1707 SHOCT-like domain-containing protein [Symbioplanes lichenis]|uniref:DUF1707 SHOCT-like domain-containing protein n=1 Tax=Symbioplanes lichenis TaxID=1629072 RepID=UPI003F68C092
MRAGDGDRQAVAEQLRGALDEGRLELHEYDDRLQRAYGAKTYGELAELVEDLPAAVVPVPRPPATPQHLDPRTDRELTARWLAEIWGSWVSVNAIMVVIWLVTVIGSGELSYFWPVWVAGPWGAVLVWQTVAGLASGQPRLQAEKKARKRAAKLERKAAKDDRRGEIAP